MTRYYLVEFERRERLTDLDPEGDAWASEPLPTGRRLRLAFGDDVDADHTYVLRDDQDPAAYAAYLTKQSVWWTYRVYHDTMFLSAYECNDEGRLLGESG